MLLPCVKVIPDLESWWLNPITQFVTQLLGQPGMEHLFKGEPFAGSFIAKRAGRSWGKNPGIGLW